MLVLPGNEKLLSALDPDNARLVDDNLDDTEVGLIDLLSDEREPWSVIV